ncbi:hypothetical protein PIB30_059261 [Stylosanthes scabra]|uniref:Uncharacterized protein n=1 Tax=Stylosanthes scabra TaxID=79078 RepID=A0ABU6YHN4_9FABA|nr:hypothetical protein [Stylosanthes scabra]
MPTLSSLKKNTSDMGTGLPFLRNEYDAVLWLWTPSFQELASFLAQKQKRLDALLGPHAVGRGVALTASKLTPFLPSVALRDRQLRSSAYFNP